jgi:OmpA-OmpF porin, OOP family
MWQLTRRYRSAVLVLAAAATLAGYRSGAMADPLPAYFSIPGSVAAVVPNSTSFKHYDEFTFDPYGTHPFAERGKHWHILFRPFTVAAGSTNEDAWTRLKSVFTAQGWTQIAASATQPYGVTLHRQASGAEAWTFISIGDPASIEADIVEAGSAPRRVVLAAPAATPEWVLPENGDFPYLAPAPGFTFSGGERVQSDFTAPVKGQDEPQVVAHDYIVKSYKQPDDLSNLEFLTIYHDALTAAGWTIDHEAIGGDVAIATHYTQNGRHIFAYLHRDDNGIAFQVADPDAKPPAPVVKSTAVLADALAKSCHVALEGIYFDFNKATLKPESDPALEKVAALLKSNPALKLEVQGHTDNVGTATYNKKLSESRAASVKAWLVAHGTAAARLTSHGYGFTQPVASNDTDAGRAKNRRVEIANPACKKS